MSTCRCPMCGRKRAGRAGGRAYGQGLVMRNDSDWPGRRRRNRPRQQARRLLRKIEKQAWQNEVRAAGMEVSDGLGDE